MRLLIALSCLVAVHAIPLNGLLDGGLVRGVGLGLDDGISRGVGLGLDDGISRGVGLGLDNGISRGVSRVLDGLGRGSGLGSYGREREGGYGQSGFETMTNDRGRDYNRDRQDFTAVVKSTNSREQDRMRDRNYLDRGIQSEGFGSSGLSGLGRGF